MRGRLIQPFLSEIERLDPDATRAADGYDDVFLEPVLALPGPGDPERGVSLQQVMPENLMLRCQVEPTDLERLRMLPAGDSPGSRIDLVYHFRELEQKGLLGPDGDALIRRGDRLVAIYEVGGAPVQQFRNPPGLFCTHVLPIGGWIGRKRNLLLVTYEARELAAEV